MRVSIPYRMGPRYRGEDMQNFYNSLTFIISFMILVLIFEMIFGSKFVEMFLLLVLASMVVFNSEKIKFIFSGIQKEA